MERPRLLSSLDTGALRDSILVGIFRGSRAGSQIFEKKANIGFCPAALARFMCGLTRIPRSPCAARRVCGSVGVRLCRVRVGVDVGGARIVSSFVCCVVKLYVTAPSQVNAAFSARWVPLGRATTTPYVDSVQTAVRPGPRTVAVGCLEDDGAATRLTFVFRGQAHHSTLGA